LQDHGITYSSPAGKVAAIHDDHVFLPFRWEWIDAFCYFPPLGSIRERRGFPAHLLEPHTLEEIVGSCVEEIVTTGGWASLLFHPFLHDRPDRLAAMDRILARIASDPRVWVASCKEVAAWIRDHCGDFPSDASSDAA